MHRCWKSGHMERLRLYILTNKRPRKGPSLYYAVQSVHCNNTSDNQSCNETFCPDGVSHFRFSRIKSSCALAASLCCRSRRASSSSSLIRFCNAGIGAMMFMVFLRGFHEIRKQLPRLYARQQLRQNHQTGLDVFFFCIPLFLLPICFFSFPAIHQERR